MSRKYNDIKIFIADLWTQVQMDYERYKQYQTLTTVVGEEVPGVDHTPSRFVSRSDDKKPYPSPKNFEAKRTPAKPPYQRQSVNSIGNDVKYRSQGDDDDDIHDIDDNQSQYESNFTHNDDENANPPIVDDDESIDENDECDFDRGDQSSINRPMNDHLNAIPGKPPFKRKDTRDGQRDNKRSGDDRTSVRSGSRSPDPKRERNGCWNILRDGICEAPNCKFSHDPEDIKKSWSNLDQMLRQTERKFGTQSERKPGGVPATSSD
jgi:hypothetical protein